MNIIKFISSRQSWSIPYAIFAAIFVVLPLLLIVVFAFTDENGALTLYNFQKFLAHPEAINTFVYSIGIAFLNTLLCILLGYPAAYILTQTRMKYANTIVMLFILPMWVNILVRTLATVALFDFAYMIILFFSALIVSLDELDFTSAFTASLTCISNVGPGLGLVGPNFGFLSPLSKLVLSFTMLLGRLEIMPLLVLFLPSVWRKK